jgi:hypothetical protein
LYDVGVGGGIILKWIFKNNEMGRACSTFGGEKRCTWSSEGKRPLETPGCRLQDNIKWVFQKWDGEAWTGFIWLRIGTGDGPL